MNVGQLITTWKEGDRDRIRPRIARIREEGRDGREREVEGGRVEETGD